MHKLKTIAAIVLLSGAGTASAACVGDPRACANTNAGGGGASYCQDNPQACLNKASPQRGALQRLLERLRELQPKLSTSDTAQSAR